MRIANRRFAGKNYNTVQIVPASWRLKRLGIFALLLLIMIWLYPAMYNKGFEGQPLYYILMSAIFILSLVFLSRASLRVYVYIDPQDRQFAVTSAGLLLSREKLDIPASEVTGVIAETGFVRYKTGEAGETTRKTRTMLALNTSRGQIRLWTYSKPANAQKAATLVEQLLSQ